MSETTEARAVPHTPTTRPRWHVGPASREALWGYVFIGPWLIGLVLFTAGPIIASLLLSLTED